MIMNLYAIAVIGEQIKHRNFHRTRMLDFGEFNGIPFSINSLFLYCAFCAVQNENISRWFFLSKSKFIAIFFVRITSKIRIFRGSSTPKNKKSNKNMHRYVVEVRKNSEQFMEILNLLKHFFEHKSFLGTLHSF